MKNIFKCKLFRNFNQYEITEFLNYIKGEEKNFKSKNIIYSALEPISNFGIILSGSVEILNITTNGEINLMFTLSQGDMICESACFTQSKKLPFDIIAKDDCTILKINYKKILSKEILNYDFYPKLMENFLNILAQNNVQKAQKMDILSRRTTEDKVLTYLSLQSKLNNSKTFFIPLNREEMATYLAVDRSALSNVLSKMAKNGTIKYHKNKFTIL